jgi:hypothetical protein
MVVSGQDCVWVECALYTIFILQFSRWSLGIRSQKRNGKNGLDVAATFLASAGR